MGKPPPLPPRSASNVSTAARSISSEGSTLSDDDWPPPYTPQAESGPYLSPAWPHQDPRSSSMSSLGPVESAGGRKKLLLIYIHGFLGNETSFKSFPAHVHNILTISLKESHVVHTKIYPRYKSRKNISFAVDNFSNWLCPHESPTTDVILLGHSLGGILAAEVAMLKSHTPGSPDLYQHRLIGVIAFDTPFLGMHPSVVKTGLASLFRSAPEPPPTPSQSSSSNLTSPQSPDPFESATTDPNYNPWFTNDVLRPTRSKIENAWYFWNKHCGELSKATASYVTSHFEFGGCLADYPGLKKRYTAIRALEDVDDLSGKRDSNGKLLRRVRFVNYYSASSGRIKPEKTKLPDERPALEMQEMNQSISHLNEEIRSTPEPQTTNSTLGVDAQGQAGPSEGLSPITNVETPRLSVEEHSTLR